MDIIENIKSKTKESQYEMIYDLLYNDSYLIENRDRILEEFKEHLVNLKSAMLCVISKANYSRSEKDYKNEIMSELRNKSQFN